MVHTASHDHGQYVKVNSLNMYYEEYGSGESLILLHGGMAAGKTVEHLVPAFSGQFRVIIPDLRGHRNTDNPDGKFSYRLMANDVAELAKVLNLSHPSICGWSDGGQIALELGMHYPLLARCLVIGGAWYQFSQQYQGMLQSIGFESPGVVNTERIRRTLPQMAEMWRVLHSSRFGADHWETLATQISVMWWTPLGYSENDFQKIKVPALILLGDRDQVIPVEEATAMYRSIPRSELVIVPGADHSLPRTRAELFTTFVLDFLVRHRQQD